MPMYDPDVIGTTIEAISQDLAQIANYNLWPSNDSDEERMSRTLLTLRTERDSLNELIESIDGYGHGDEGEAADR